MKNETKDTLLSFIKSGVYGLEGCSEGYDLHLLYKLFSMMEVKTLEDIEETAGDFFRFVLENKNRILKTMKSKMLPLRFLPNRITRADRENFDIDLAMLDLKLKYYLDPENRLKQDAFAGIVREFTGGNNCIIADIGAGPIPEASFEMAEYAKEVYAIDQFLLSTKFLKEQGVNGIEGYFDSKTPVDKYDILVGRKPCGAIRPMVEAAAKSNKPYLIDLCDCDLKNQTMPDGSSVSSWKQLLPEIDPRVKFHESFAYTIDATPEQIDRATNRAMEEVYGDPFIDFITIGIEMFMQDWYEKMGNEKQ